MPQEEMIYEDSRVKVSTSRVIFPDKTYALANITSVAVGHEDPSVVLPWIIMLFGIGAALISGTIWSIGEGGGICIGGSIVIAIVGWFMYRDQKGKVQYIVMLSSAASEIQAMSDPSETYIKKIANAISEAIVKRG